jgi:hypothetical protein
LRDNRGKKITAAVLSDLQGKGLVRQEAFLATDFWFFSPLKERRAPQDYRTPRIRNRHPFRNNKLLTNS